MGARQLVVQDVDDGGQVIAGGSGDDDLLRACVDVSLSLRLGGVETGALEDDVHADLLPGKIRRVLLGVDLDLLAVDDDGAVFCLDLVRESVSALRAVELEQVSKHLSVGEVVDGDDLVALCRKHLTESQAADPSETVDRNSNILCHNYESSEGFISMVYKVNHSFVLAIFYITRRKNTSVFNYKAARARNTFPCRMRPGPAVAKDFLHARA